MPDPTIDFLNRFNDPSQWAKVIDNVPIFVCHETEENGEPIKVDMARLERIAANIRSKQISRGVVMPFKDGHTVLETDPVTGQKKLAPPDKQPAIISYGINARIGTWGPKNLPAILATEYVCLGKDERRRMLPFRSAEFYQGQDDIDAVALQATKPRLDMGMVAYTKDRFCFYAAQGFHYAAEGAPMAEPKADPTEKPDARAPSDEDMGKWQACCHYAYPHLSKMHEAYAAAMGPTNGIDPMTTETPAIPKVPGGTEKVEQDQWPAGGNKAGQAAAMGAKRDDPHGDYHPSHHPDEKGREKHYMNVTLPTQYTAELAKRDARVAALEKKLRLSEYEAELSPLAIQYGFDLAKQVAKAGDMERPAFDAFKADLVEMAIAIQGKVSDPTFYSGYIPTNGDGKKKDEDHKERARKTLRANPGMTWDQALEKTPK